VEVALGDKFLIVCSLDRQTGKTIFSLGLARILIKRGFNVGYFKPLGQRTYVTREGAIVDEDAYTMKSLLNLKEDIEELSPYIYHYDFLNKVLVKNEIEGLREGIIERANKIAEDKDIVIVEAHGCLWTGMSAGLSSLDLANILNAPVLILVNYDPVYICDRLLLLSEILENRKIDCLGTIIFGVKPGGDVCLNVYVLPRLSQFRFKVIGMLPTLREIIPLTAREVCEAIDARIIIGEEWLNRPIENFLVGAMTTESASKYFRVTSDKAVVTGGDREDIILAALETPTLVLVLTGNLYPSEKVINTAKEKRVPILLSPYDTYTTVKKIEEYRYTIRYLDENRINLLTDTVERKMNIDEIIRELNLS